MFKVIASLAAGYSLARVLEAQDAGVPLDLAFKHFTSPVARLRRSIEAQSAAAREAAAAAAAAEAKKKQLSALAVKRKKGQVIGRLPGEMSGFRIPASAFRAAGGAPPRPRRGRFGLRVVG